MNSVGDIQKSIQSLELDSADDNNEEIAEEVKSDETEQKEVEIKGVHPPLSLPEEEDKNHLSRNKMDPKQQRQQRKVTPRLDRRIAKKSSNEYNEYDGEEGRDASTSFSSSLLEEEDYSSILKIHPYKDFASSDDGEINRILLSLGLSDLEDFAISPSDWKESKANSESQARVKLTDDAICSSSTFITPGSSSGGGGGGGGGIKSVQPPRQASPHFLTPPPSLSRPVLDWDLISSFDPKDSTYDVDSTRSCFGVEQEDLEIGVHDIISPNGRFRRNIRSWTKGTFLGSGSWGTVYEGFSDDGFFFAVKEVSLLDQGNQGQKNVYQLEQEIALLSNFEHENIVQYLGTDKAEDKLYIFLELVTKGSLAQLYQKYDLRDSQVSSYTRQILHGLKYLHDRDVVHRDIKCANILMDANGSVKLADFGLAKTTKLNDVKSSKGTAFWTAPEVVNGKNTGYGLPADIWSLGCTVLEMLTHQLPYAPLEWMQAIYRIGKGEPPSVPNNLSEDARSFILKCLQVKPEDRPTAAMLLDHPFVHRSLPTSSFSNSPLYSSWR